MSLRKKDNISKMTMQWKRGYVESVSSERVWQSRVREREEWYVYFFHSPLAPFPYMNLCCALIQKVIIFSTRLGNLTPKRGNKALPCTLALISFFKKRAARNRLPFLSSSLHFLSLYRTLSVPIAQLIAIWPFVGMWSKHSLSWTP